MKAKPLYTHLWLAEECSTKEQAEDFALLWREMIACLGEKMPVFERCPPEVSVHRDFESLETNYRAYCRFSVGPSWIGVSPGVIKSRQGIYDNGEMCTPFGLAPNETGKS